MILQILQYTIAFAIFVVLQGLAINGVYESMRGSCTNDINKGLICTGNILYPFKRWLSKYISEYWLNPIGNCPRCMSSLYGALSFFPTVIYLFGFHLIEIPIYIFDVFILVSVNWIIYKKM